MRVKPELWVIPLLVAGCAAGETDGAGTPGAPAPAVAATPAPAPAPPPAAAPAPAPAAAGGAATIWDGVYTTAQANRGSATARSVCFACHSQSEWTRPLFLRGWNGRPIAGLWELISDTMPYDSPGGLSNEEYADLVAYMLQLNDVPAGETELPANGAGLGQIMVTAQN